MSCPYSLSRPGGVQGQVLGLARELRELGVDVRVVAPVRRSAARAGRRHRRAERRVRVNGSVAPIAPGRAAARRTLEALRSVRARRRAPARAAVARARPRRADRHRRARWSARSTPRRASGCVRDAAARRCGRDDARAWPCRVAVSARGARAMAELDLRRRVRRCCGTASRSTASRRPRRRRRPAPAVLFVGRHEPRKGLEVLLDAWAGARPRRGALGRRRRPADRRRCSGAARAAASSGSGAVTDAEKQAAAARARPSFCAPSLRRRVVRRRAARGDGRGHAGRRVRHRGLPQRRPRRARRAARAARRRRRAPRRALRRAARRPGRCGTGSSPRAARRAERVLDGARSPSATSSSTSRRSPGAPGLTRPCPAARTAPLRPSQPSPPP